MQAGISAQYGSPDALQLTQIAWTFLRGGKKAKFAWRKHGSVTPDGDSHWHEGTWSDTNRTASDCHRCER